MQDLKRVCSRQPPDSEVFIPSKARHHQSEDRWPCLLRPFPSMKYDLVSLEPSTTQHPERSACHPFSDRSHRRDSSDRSQQHPNSPRPTSDSRSSRSHVKDRKPPARPTEVRRRETAKVKGRTPYDVPGKHPAEAKCPRPLSAAPLLSCPLPRTQGRTYTRAADFRVLKNQRSGP